MSTRAQFAADPLHLRIKCTIHDYIGEVLTNNWLRRGQFRCHGCAHNKTEAKVWRILCSKYPELTVAREYRKDTPGQTRLDFALLRGDQPLVFVEVDGLGRESAVPSPSTSYLL